MYINFRSKTFLTLKKLSRWLQKKLHSKTINLPEGCVKCPLKALIDGQLSALASLAKAENVHFGKIFTCFLQNLFLIRIWRAYVFS